VADVPTTAILAIDWPGSLPFFLVLDWIVRLTMVGVVLLRRREPSVSLAWCAVVLSVPIVGALSYLMFGEARLGHRRLRRYREIVARIEHPEARRFSHDDPATNALNETDRQIALLAESVGGNIPRTGNRMQLFGDTDVVVQRLVEDIDAAREHVHVLFYIWLADDSGRRVAEALLRAAKRGVACRVLVDDVGSRDFLRGPLRTALEHGGVRVAGALPVNLLRVALARIDLRNPRKIAVIDRAIGWTGSQNIANADFAPKRRYAPWVDCMVRIEGPVVRDLQTLFVEDWYLDTDESLEELLVAPVAPREGGVTTQLLGTGPASSRAPMRLLVQAMTQVAREELILTTPYFVPDEATLLSLASAARRGVTTKLVVPRRNDSHLVALASRSFYDPLLDAGVDILEFRDGLLHAKTLTVDRRVGLISSANLDRRSFDLNFESGLVVFDDDFSSQLRFLQVGYVEASTPVSPAAWRRRIWPVRLAQNAAGLLAPVL
jgi:cardiolipin synthase